MMGASGASRQKPSTNSRRRPDPPDTGDQPAAVDRGPHAIPHRMARLLRLLPDPSRAHDPGSVDPPKITLVSLAAVAERAQSLQRTAPSWRAKVQCSGRRRFADGVLAHVRTPGGPIGNKNCHYETEVSVVRAAVNTQGQPMVSFDEGKTWHLDAPAPNSTKTHV